MVVEEGGVNCVCVVQNGRFSRLTTEMEYVYMSLSDILPKEIEK